MADEFEGWRRPILGYLRGSLRVDADWKEGWRSTWDINRAIGTHNDRRATREVYCELQRMVREGLIERQQDRMRGRGSEYRAVEV